MSGRSPDHPNREGPGGLFPLTAYRSPLTLYLQPIAMTSPNLPIWSDGTSLGLPPLRGEVWADTVVVGLGATGLAAVLELAARKKTVVGIEAGSVGSGAAGRNGGFLLAGLHAFHHDVVKEHGRAAADEIYRMTMAELDRVSTETPEAVRRTG